MKKFTAATKGLSRELAILAFLIVSIVIFTALEPGFLTVNTLVDIVEQASINGVLALGVTLVIITGGIDLSVGATMALSIILVGKLAVAGVPPIPAHLIGLGIGGALGMVNGLLVTKMKLQPFVATLGTQSMLRGIAYIVTGGWPVLNIPKGFRNVLNSVMFGKIRVFAVVFVILAIIYHFILRKTKTGTYIYSIGSNREATKLSGVNTDRHEIAAYVLCGIVCGFAALVMLARLGTGEASAGQGYELDAIAAAAIGGTSLAGGKGSILGTVIGAVLLSTLKIGLIVIGVDTFIQLVAVGVIIIIASYVEVMQKNISEFIKKRRQ